MALKRKITKEAWEKLSKDLQFEYKADGDNFVLQTEGDEDIGPLKRAHEREKELRREAETKLDTVTEELDKAKRNRTGNDRDVERLTASHERKLKEVNEEKDAVIAKREGQLKTLLVDNAALTLAQKIAPKAPKVILPHIKARMAANLEGDEPKAEFLGADGKVDKKLTTDAIEKEFLANKDFSAIVAANQASGGGAPQRSVPAVKPVNAGGAQASPDQPQLLSKLSPKALADAITATKAEKAAAAE